MTAHSTQHQLTSLDDSSSPLIAALNNPFAFGHPIRGVELIETHISWVLLTGDYAYKIKKPVDFGFLDFSTLEKRRYCCEQELRLNRRFAPEIYLDLVEIRGSATRPHIGGQGEIIEYAIKMREFPQACLLSEHASRHQLDPAVIDEIGLTLAKVHAHVDWADESVDYGNAETVRRWSAENLAHITSAIPAAHLPRAFVELRRWYVENDHLPALADARKAGGHVRECHGDLHLGNMALLHDRVTFFDCIEFNPELRWIDTISEAAFVAMDLHARGYENYCWRFLNRYLEHSGDYDGVCLLGYYFVYRALVRAKVEALRVQQHSENLDYANSIRHALDYIELAWAWASGRRPALILMHGLSGSGKSTVAAELVEELGAICLRSDVERKRMHGYAPDESSRSDLERGIYGAAATAATYQRLADLAGLLLKAGVSVIVDAAFLKQSQRQILLGIKRETNCHAAIVSCQAAEDVLRARISARRGDASEATLEVLERQLDTHQPISEREQDQTAVITLGSDGLDSVAVEKLRACLFN